MALFSSQYTGKSTVDNPHESSLKNSIPIQLLKNSLHFFENFTYDKDSGNYFSDVDSNGRLLSNNIQLKALSRLVYSMAYSSEFFPENLSHAQRAAQFIMDKMIKRDRNGLYFISTYLSEGNLMVSNKLSITDQAAGFCGLVELYRFTKNDQLLSLIHELYDSFILRFYDSKHGGFFDTYSTALEQQRESKSFQSMMYPLSVFILNLWKADVKNSNKYEPIIKAQLEIAARELWNEQTGWVNVNINNTNKTNTHQNSLAKHRKPGHNFQLAKILLQTDELTFLSAEEIEQYKKMGGDIVDATMSKPIWDNNGFEGFFSDMQTDVQRIVSQDKSSWQHAEAISALSYFPEKYETELKRLSDFFYNYFVDIEYGGEFLRLNKENEPSTTQPKGCKSKASFHTVEMLKSLQHNIYGQTKKKLD